jgi:SecD/SecF fusion protein
MLIIVLVVGFLAYWAYLGVQDGRLQLGIDLRGGSEIIGEFDFSDMEGDSAEALKTSIGIIQERVDAYGLKDIAIQPIGDRRFSVQVSDKETQSVEAIKGLITVLGRLEFHITVEPSATNYDHYWKRFKEGLDQGLSREEIRYVAPEDRHKDDIQNGRYPLGLTWYPLGDRAKEDFPGARRPEGGQPWILCKNDDFRITGESLQNATYRRDTQSLGGDWKVVFNVAKLFQKNMAGLTQNEGDFMAILLNDEAESAPVLRSTLTSNGEISGSFTEEEAKALSAVLQAGSLKKKPELIAERTVAADLAGDARDTGIFSTALAFGLVLIVMVWLYLAPGLLANLALLLNLVIVVGVLTWFEAVLTLPGLAGLVLTVGMAVDANILVFERIKEEKSKGRTIAQAVATGYDRALVTIIDSNLTTLITAYFLFQIGSGPVRGFGITLAIGILASMFTALFVTRTIMGILLRRGSLTEAKMRGEFSPPGIPWMSMKRPAILISTLAMIGGVILYVATPEKKKYDLDFTQGAKLVMRFKDPKPLEEVRDRIEAMGDMDKRFRSVSVRIVAEGIGAAVGSTESDGFELRTQEIGKKDDVDAFVLALREEFKGDLLPGPFLETIADAPGGRSVGTLYLVQENVDQVLVEQALQQFSREKKRLRNPTAVPAEAVPGAPSVFTLTFDEPASNPGGLDLNVRTALAEFNLEAARVWLTKQTTDENVTPTQQEAARKTLADLAALEKLPDRVFEQSSPFPLRDIIAPSTAQEHRDAAVKAIALSIVGIIIYVAFRFRSWAFGFAAVVALVHDVMVVLGIVALVNWFGIFDARLNLVTVAAFLTLIGYSINDSIVVFDRIRENRGSGRSRMSEIIDKALNQTLSRTLRTTGTTFLVVFIMLIMNYGAGSSLEGFAFILALGVLVGTYSSIFIASPTLLYLPWLWEKCGSSMKSLLLRSLPWMVGASAGLVAIDSAMGGLATTDPSVIIFNDIVLGVPLGILIFFLFHFIRFVSRERPAEPAAAA